VETPSQHIELVRHALYARDVKQVGCFAFNKASERVQEVGVPILSALEQVIREEVTPSCPLDPTAQHQAFPGLGNLLVDYFHIAKDGQMERAAKFFSSLRGPALAEAVRAIGIVWDHTIPEAFQSTIEMAARTGSTEEQGIASWSLDWHRNKPQRDEELAETSKKWGVSARKE
jgi:hypothetical protein